MPPHDETTVAFVTFETEFAKYGGLGAVMTELPRAMAAQRATVVVAPFFREIIYLDALETTGRIEDYSTVVSFHLSIRGRPYGVKVIRVLQRIDTDDGQKELATYLVDADGFFTAASAPYVNPCDPTSELDPYQNPINPDRLTEDALFFCLVVPRVLVELTRVGLVSPDLLLHLQDWETACVGKALQTAATQPALRSVKCVLTLHNPYDRFLSPFDSALVQDLATRLNLATNANVLPQAMDCIDGPISTVSENFALELTGDPLHTVAFASHLQPSFAEKGVIGVNNGMFSDLDFPAEAIDAAAQGDYRPLIAENTKRRDTLNGVLTEYQPGKAWGKLGDLDDFTGPVFLMFGRDDPRQKGYDLAAEAVRRIPLNQAKFIFTPMPGDESKVGLRFLKQLAKDRRGEVKVFPFRMKRGYVELQKGSSFILMPSFYEPFGGAVEGYAVGTPVVARDTGGLRHQVVPYPLEQASGFLFREDVQVAPHMQDRDGWPKIIRCDYWNSDPKGDRLEDRRGTQRFESMVDATAGAIQAAIDFYRSDLETGQLAYAQMVYNGFKILEQFTWTRAIQEYQSRLYGW